MMTIITSQIDELMDGWMDEWVKTYQKVLVGAFIIHPSILLFVWGQCALIPSLHASLIFPWTTSYNYISKHASFSHSDLIVVCLCFLLSIGVICKVTRLAGENGRIIGHQTCNWEWKFLQSKISGTQTSFSTNFGGQLSFICLSCFLSASIAATYIFSAPSCTTTIITLEPCALNAKFQHFILRFNKISLLCKYHSTTW